MRYDRSKIIRLRDKVRIITPEIFIRVGYPLTKEYVKEKHITKEDKQTILDLLRGRQTLRSNIVNIFNTTKTPMEEKSYNEILDALAYYKLRNLNFGGKEREVITEAREGILGKVFEVFSKRFVKTGTYRAGGYLYDDYDPPRLIGEKTSVILRVYPCYNVDDNLIVDSSLYDSFEIEAKNVEKVVDKVKN